MNERYLAGYFEHEKDLYGAALEAQEKGLRLHEVFSPYPLHGMEDVIGLRRSRLSQVGFVAGFSGLLGSIVFIYWAAAFDWPLVIGGKPMNSWSAFTPLAFEVTVLFAGVIAIAALFVRSRFWPGRSQPLIPEATDDQFVLVLKELDAAFDPAAAGNLLTKHGAVKIWDSDTLMELDDSKSFGEKCCICCRSSIKRKIGWAVCLLAPVFVVTLIQAGSRNYSRPNLVWPIQMADDPAFGAYEPNPYLSAGMTMQLPPEGAIPRGYHLLRYDTTETSLARAGEDLKNPYTPGQEVLDRGKHVFETFCLICHGTAGAGDGPIIPKYPNPPSFRTEQSLNRKDGEMFVIISRGRRNMPSYASQVSWEDRWKVILYIRQLQLGKP